MYSAYLLSFLPPVLFASMSLWAWDRPWRLGGQDSHEARDSWSLVGSLDSALAIPERLRSRSHRRVVNSISGRY